MNLHAALLRLRDRFLERIIWVDAICINQLDLNERSSQVQRMAMIYALANRVIVWLGEAEDNSDQALEEVHESADGQQAGDDQEIQNAVLKLLQRPWFKRIWVKAETLTSITQLANEFYTDSSRSCCSSERSYSLWSLGNRWIYFLHGNQLAQSQLCRQPRFTEFNTVSNLLDTAQGLSA